MGKFLNSCVVFFSIFVLAPELWAVPKATGSANNPKICAIILNDVRTIDPELRQVMNSIRSDRKIVVELLVSARSSDVLKGLFENLEIAGIQVISQTPVSGMFHSIEVVATPKVLRAFLVEGQKTVSTDVLWAGLDPAIDAKPILVKRIVDAVLGSAGKLVDVRTSQDAVYAVEIVVDRDLDLAARLEEEFSTLPVTVSIKNIVNPVPESFLQDPRFGRGLLEAMVRPVHPTLHVRFVSQQLVLPESWLRVLRKQIYADEKGEKRTSFEVVGKANELLHFFSQSSGAKFVEYARLISEPTVSKELREVLVRGEGEHVVTLQMMQDGYSAIEKSGVTLLSEGKYDDERDPTGFGGGLEYERLDVVVRGNTAQLNALISSLSGEAQVTLGIEPGLNAHRSKRTSVIEFGERNQLQLTQARADSWQPGLAEKLLNLSAEETLTLAVRVSFLEGAVAQAANMVQFRADSLVHALRSSKNKDVFNGNFSIVESGVRNIDGRERFVSTYELELYGTKTQLIEKLNLLHSGYNAVDIYSVSEKQL